MSRSLAEQETVIRFDRSATMAVFWTAAATMAGKWRRLGYPVAAEGSGWRAEVPIRALTFRRLGQKPPQAQKQAIPPGFLRATSAGRV
jgi:hypothetical protein